jgi:hypothetical protein
VKPVAASKLVAQSVAKTSVQLIWKDNSTNEDGFIIQRKTTKGGDAYAEVARVGAGVISYTDTGLNKNWEYDYQVVAFNSAGNAAASNKATVQVGVKIVSPSPVPSPSPSPTVKPSPSPSPSPSPEVSIRVTSATSSYTDSLGQVWAADSHFSGGQEFSASSPISNTSTPALYQSEHYGNFSYSFDVPNGTYKVTLKFAEIYWSSAGSRVFNVSINGEQVLSNFDIFADAGAANTADDKSFVTEVDNGNITIQFQSVVDQAKISSIEIVSASSGPAPSPSPVKPAAASSLVATSASATSVALGWKDNSNNESGFIIQRKTTKGGDAFVEIARTGANALSYLDSGLNQYWEYDYQVIAYNAVGNAAASNIATLQVGAGPSADPAQDTGSGSDTGAVSSGTPPQAPATAARVSCANNSGDAGLIQNALNSKGAVVISGTCNLGGSSITMASNQFMGGPATLNYNGGDYAVYSSGSGNTIASLTFNGGGVNLNNGNTQAGWTIEYNTFQNITSGQDGVHINHILGEGAHSSISHNHFKNIWSGGYPNLPAGQSAGSCGNDDCLYGSGIFWNYGLDNTTIDDNVMDQIGFNGIKGFWDGMMGFNNAYQAKNNVISNNVVTNYHRIAIEFQGAGMSNCPGGCNFTLSPNDGLVVKGNYAYKPAFTNNAFAFSFMGGSTNSLIINNTALNDVSTCYFRAAIGLEHSMDGGVLQGNVIGGVPQSCYANGWADIVSAGYSKAQYTNRYQNNTFCGPGAGNGDNGTRTIWDGQDPYNLATMVENADLWTNSCPNPSNIGASIINMAVASVNSSSFNISVVSNLSIRNVQFFVDGSSTPLITQEVQDYNGNFVNDRKWLYHASLSSVSSGSHTIKAVATDVSGATKSISQSFTK